MLLGTANRALPQGPRRALLNAFVNGAFQSGVFSLDLILRISES
jgi:hypothetical protein